MENIKSIIQQLIVFEKTSPNLFYFLMMLLVVAIVYFISLIVAIRKSKNKNIETPAKPSSPLKQEQLINQKPTIKTEPPAVLEKPIKSKPTVKEGQLGSTEPFVEQESPKKPEKFTGSIDTPATETEIVNEQRPAYSTTKSGILFVDYEIKKTKSETTYPVFKYPKKGTVVRSYREGSLNLRGFKEESFQNSIEYYFGKLFTVTGNIHIATSNHTRPYEPDIAIIDNSVSNLRIDIEIDEPYAAIKRNPTHCKGEDYFRDLFFTDSGWIVIRFSEYQIHTQEMSCLRFIAEVILSALPKYTILELPTYLRQKVKQHF